MSGTSSDEEVAGDERDKENIAKPEQQEPPCASAETPLGRGPDLITTAP